MIKTRRITLASTSGLLALGLTASGGLAMPLTVESGSPGAVNSVVANDDATAGITHMPTQAPAADALTGSSGEIVAKPLPAPTTTTEAPLPTAPEADVASDTAPETAGNTASAPETQPLKEIVEDALADPQVTQQAEDAISPAEGTVSSTLAESPEAEPVAVESPVADTETPGEASPDEADVAGDTLPAPDTATPDAEALTETVEEVVDGQPSTPDVAAQEVLEVGSEAQTAPDAQPETAARPAAEPEAPAEDPAVETDLAEQGDDVLPATDTSGATEAVEAPVDEPVAETVEVVEAPGSEEIAAALETAIADGAEVSKSHAASLARFYSAREYAPLWIDGGKFGGQARAVIHRLEAADDYGLDPARYATPALDTGLDGQASPADLAAAEIALTMAAVRFAQDAQAGTFDPATLGELMTARPVRPEMDDVLDGLAEASDQVAYLEGFNPPQPQFKALQKLLAELRERTVDDVPPQVGDGPSLKPGMRDDRVPVLRARLDVAAIEGVDSLIYDDTTVDAVKAFQDKASLEVDGVIGPQTRAALNGGAEITIADVLVNMERWRWVPRDMGSLHVWVNIPEYWLRVMSDGTPMFETRVIVGKAENQTPIFSDEIEYVDVNPFWNVPRSIAVKEMLPHIRQDPGFLNRQGLQVLYKTGGREYLVDPYAVDWSQFNADNLPFRFRQPPGGGNALGRVKFMFPNKHAVYLHDTPTRHLFAKSVRAFSHGCVRVDKPVDFADALLSREDQLNGQRIKNLIGGGSNGELPMKRHVPVHLTYFTVWVDSAGETQKRPDIYDYDKRMKSAMGLGS